MADTQRYRAFILRGWLETAEDDAHTVWRFRLRDVQSGEERAFASPEAVAAYLAQTFDVEQEDDDSLS